MRKILVILLGCLVAFSAGAEENYQQKAEQIYDMCDKKIPQVDDDGVLSGNIADVKRERLLRKCLKDETVKIVSAFIRADEIENFTSALDNMENDAFGVYRLAMFCKKGDEDFWCHQSFVSDTSINKLILEKNLTSQMMKFLTDMLEIRNDDL